MADSEEKESGETEMSYRCGEHGWAHLLHPCPSCMPEFTVSNNIIIPIPEQPQSFNCSKYYGDMIKGLSVTLEERTKDVINLQEQYDSAMRLVDYDTKAILKLNEQLDESLALLVRLFDHDCDEGGLEMNIHTAYNKLMNKINGDRND